jgi:hypothetical protein
MKEEKPTLKEEKPTPEYPQLYALVYTYHQPEVSVTLSKHTSLEDAEVFLEAWVYGFGRLRERLSIRMLGEGQQQ